MRRTAFAGNEALMRLCRTVPFIRESLKSEREGEGEDVERYRQEKRKKREKREGYIFKEKRPNGIKR